MDWKNESLTKLKLAFWRRWWGLALKEIPIMKAFLVKEMGFLTTQNVYCMPKARRMVCLKGMTIVISFFNVHEKGTFLIWIGSLESKLATQQINSWYMIPWLWIWGWLGLVHVRNYLWSNYKGKVLLKIYFPLTILIYKKLWKILAF